jgi:hypothetical protein
MIGTEQLQQSYAHARLNRQFMTPGAACRCFYCLRGFSTEQISRWTDDGNTALCPHCGIDAVLSSNADPLSDALIQQLHTIYFGSSRKYTDREWRHEVAEKQQGRLGSATMVDPI